SDGLGAITLGLAVGLSSSIVIVNITRSKRRTLDDASARALLVWSVLQDVVTLVAATILAVVLSPGEAGSAPIAFGKAVLFVAIGTLVDPAAIARERVWLVAVLALVGVKVLASWLFAWLFRVPARRPQLGVGLGQIGEFSFVVLGLGTGAGVVSAAQFSAALAAAAITIAASAVGVRMFPRGAPQG